MKKSVHILQLSMGIKGQLGFNTHLTMIVTSTQYNLETVL